MWAVDLSLILYSQNGVKVQLYLPINALLLFFFLAGFREMNDSGIQDQEEMMSCHSDRKLARSLSFHSCTHPPPTHPSVVLLTCKDDFAAFVTQLVIFLQPTLNNFEGSPICASLMLLGSIMAYFSRLLFSLNPRNFISLCLRMTNFDQLVNVRFKLINSIINLLMHTETFSFL